MLSFVIVHVSFEITINNYNIIDRHTQGLTFNLSFDFLIVKKLRSNAYPEFSKQTIFDWRMFQIHRTDNVQALC